MALFDLLFESAVKAYSEALRSAPRLTIIVSGATACILGVITSLSIKQDQARERQRLQAVGYGDQLNQLDTVQQSLKNLSAFVEGQKSRLQDSEQIVSNLNEEKKRIEPVVQADRKVLEAMFQLQEQRSAGSVWKERFIGFGFGVFASLLASFIYGVGANLLRTRRISG